MVDPSVGASAVAAVPAILAAVLAYRASTHGRQNGETLAKVEKQTNGELDKKIERAVRKVVAENPDAITGAVISEALRDLLDGILEAASDDH